MEKQRQRYKRLINCPPLSHGKCTKLLFVFSEARTRIKILRENRRKSFVKGVIRSRYQLAIGEVEDSFMLALYTDGYFESRPREGGKRRRQRYEGEDVDEFRPIYRQKLIVP